LFISENGVPTQKGISNALRRGKMHCGSCGSSIEESMIVPLFHLIDRQQAISVLGSVIKQCCGKITRADQTAHEANGKSRHGYALALVSSHDIYFFVFFFFFYVCVDLFMVCLVELWARHGLGLYFLSHLA